ncbi:MAG TPA: alpha/beta fold hydrolase [Armatimonadota bacterium]|nr:alpha/beta fold hydrolase [Armatimonadota bacterium]
MTQHTTLFLLPHAGGASFSYAPFRRCFPQTLDVRPVDLSGHGTRLSEPLLDTIPAMAADILAHHLSTVPDPYILFGHSMGATLAYEVCCQALIAGLPLPAQLIVSGRQGPAIVETRRRSMLPSKEFRAHLKNLGGISDEVLAQPELMDMFEPIIRADFAAIETYVPSSSTLLPIPVLVLAGRDDEVTDDELMAWQQITTVPITIQRFPGGHFYLFEHAQQVADIVINAIALTKGKN